MEKVTVIIPTYNREKYIARSLDSVLNQTYKDINIVVIDDGSVDKTGEIIAGYQEKYPDKIQYVRTENQGAAQARNIGMSMADGEFIAFQDSDDCWVEDKLEKQMNAMEKTKSDFSYSYIEYHKDNTRIVIPNQGIPLKEMSGNIYNILLRQNMIGTPTLVMRHTCYECIGDFDTMFPALEDYDFALRLSREFRGVFVPECLLKGSLSAGNRLSDNYENYILANCILIGKYKEDLLEQGLFESKVKSLYEDAQNGGIEEWTMKALERIVLNGRK